ncbi:MAG TPA: DUF2059 domain-containing protein [Candidatus Acidoferrales bacterium]|nr:DUF2059 domain-containing protein [Candidatus Acidoferrales bacterium]
MKGFILVAVSLVLGASAQVARGQAPPKTDSPAVPAAPANIDPVKAADIQRLIELAGLKKGMSETMALMEANIRPTMLKALPPGDYREKLIDLFFERFHSKISVQQLLDAAAAAYDKYLSDEDIKGLIQFYQTPLGQKTLTILPKLTAELQAEGMRIGQQAGQESMAEVLAEHPEIAKAMSDAAGR